MKPHRTVTAVTLGLLVHIALPGPATAQAPPDAAMRVDEIFASWTSVTSAGCAVGVEENGLIVLERAYGMADLEHDVPNTPGSIFEGGSLSKQFTAAAVVLLALDGKLSLDDDVRTYLPELPDYGTPITLRHMLTHTSGLRDWGSVAAISGWGREQKRHRQVDVLDIASRQSALNFEPGHEYSYSNTGYNLLAMVVGRVSGMPFADFSRERVFEPLGLTHTQWRNDPRRIVKGRSNAYNAKRDGGFEINQPIEFAHGNGGILTTVGDLLIWNRALTDGRLGGPDFVRMMHTRGRLTDGSTIRYAAGLVVGESFGLRSITHTGSTAGYRAYIGRYPDQKLSVAMLCNASNVPTGATGGRVARVYLGDLAEDATPPTAASVPAGTAERLAGLYRDPVTGFTKRLRAEGESLREGGTILVPLTRERFQLGSRPRFYDFHEGPGESWFSVDSWEYTDQRYERVSAWDPPAEALADFTGTYTSPDARATLVIRMRDGHLESQRRPGETQPLTPVYADTFRAGFGTMIRFRRDPGGKVTGFSLSLPRVYDMRFDRAGG
jgi:CubicO group peptidase (beta-lactamase class C family)